MAFKLLTHKDVKEEMTRRKTKRNDLLNAFERKGSLTTGEVLQLAGTGMSSRLKELERQGHVIVREYDQPGRWIYTYIGNKNDD